MKIVNKNSKKTVANHSTLCNSFWSKTRGLIFKKPQTLVFTFPKPKKVSLHMIGVFHDIDIIVLNEYKKVLQIDSLKSFSGRFRSKIKAKYVIECPKGTIKNARIVVGNTLDFKT